MKIGKRRTLEQYYGDELSIAAGLKPLVEELVILNGIPALRYLVLSRKVFYKIIRYAETADTTKPRKGLSTNKLISILNGVLFGDGYPKLELEKSNKEFKGLISVINSTVYSYFLDNIQLSSRTRTALLKEMENAFKAVNIVYGPIVGESLSDDTNRSMELFLLKFPENKKDEEKLSNKKESTGDEVSGEINNESEKEKVEVKKDNKTNAKDKDLQLLSRREVAEIFDISLPTLADWEKNNSIPKAVRIGSRIYFRESDIINHINASNSEVNIK